MPSKKLSAGKSLNPFAAKGAGSPRGKSRHGAAEAVLGVSVTDRYVHAVLLRAAGGGYDVLRSFTRHRALDLGGADGPAMVERTPELPSGTMSDFTINFGGGGMGSPAPDLFLGSEFENVGVLPGRVEVETAEEKRPAPFPLELRDILEECAEVGFDSPQVAFCVYAPEIQTTELLVSSRVRKTADRKAADKKAGDKKAGDKKPAAKKPEAKAAPAEGESDAAALVALLGETLGHAVDPERVDFFPMTRKEGQKRFMALVPEPTEPTIPTLEALRETSAGNMPPVRTLDTEISLYPGLVRFLVRPEETAHSVFVRVGQADTLVVLMQGEEVQHAELLRSLTVFDAPETICSRVLLQQDEHGIGNVDHVLLLSEEREEDLVSAFQMFYPESGVETLQTTLARAGVRTGSEDGLPLELVPAVGVGLRLVADQRGAGAGFLDVNLLPKRLRRKKIRVPFAWHTLAAAALLAVTALVFFGQYARQEHRIDTIREQMRQYPPVVDQFDGPALQTRIDSLKALYNSYTRAIVVLDSLLIGSDRWSRGLEKVSRDAAATGGIWIERWQPSDNLIRIEGSATDRHRVVLFAERQRGTIEMLKFSEIREWPVYQFAMQIPNPYEMPAAARFLQDQVKIAPPAPRPAPH